MCVHAWVRLHTFPWGVLNTHTLKQTHTHTHTHTYTHILGRAPQHASIHTTHNTHEQIGLQQKYQTMSHRVIKTASINHTVSVAVLHTALSTHPAYICTHTQNKHPYTHKVSRTFPPPVICSLSRTYPLKKSIALTNFLNSHPMQSWGCKKKVNIEKKKHKMTVENITMLFSLQPNAVLGSMSRWTGGVYNCVCAFICAPCTLACIVFLCLQMLCA